MNFRTTWLRRLHLCIGSLLSVPLVMIGLTGSILVFEPELQPGAALGAASPGPSRDLGAIFDAARAAVPDGFAPSLFSPPAAAGELAMLRAGDPRHPGPGGLEIYVDPASLALRGTVKSGEGWLREIFFLHTNMGEHDRSGRALGGWAGVAMCVLAVSGIVMQFPSRRRWRQAVLIQRGARGYRLLRQVHGVIGFWFWLLLLIVSFSGVWLSFPQTFNDMAGSLGLRDLRPMAAAPHVTPARDTAPLDIAEVAALAQAALPDLPLRSIALPQRADQPYRVSLGAEHALPVVVFVDPWQRRVAALRDPRDYSFAERAVASMHAIHDGSGFCWVWRALVFASGLLPALFATSGIAMWLAKRRLDRAARLARLAPFGAPGE